MKAWELSSLVAPGKSLGAIPGPGPGPAHCLMCQVPRNEMSSSDCLHRGDSLTQLVSQHLVQRHRGWLDLQWFHAEWPQYSPVWLLGKAGWDEEALRGGEGEGRTAGPKEHQRRRDRRGGRQMLRTFLYSSFPSTEA